MRVSSLIVLVSFFGLTVSCAHKPQVDEGAKVKKTTMEKKIDKKAEAKKLADNKAYTCLVGKDQRTVTLDQREKRCEVNYTKFGDTQQVAWAEATPSICEDAFSNIRSNIEGSGYKCMDGDDVTFIQPKKQEPKKKPLETAAN
jgi:hypothetical protein